MPLLRTYAGGGVALANRAAALNAPVVCNPQILSTELDVLKKKSKIMKTNKFLQGMIHKPLQNFLCLFLVSMLWYLY